MFPTLFTLRFGGRELAFHTYGVLIAVGLAAGIALAYREGKRRGFDGGRVLDAAFQACTRHGGTLSHHHGIGLGKARWMELEYGAAGLGVLRAVQRALDPGGILNPGKIGAAP